MADIVIPSAWVSPNEDGLQGTAMIIGATDTAKSTLGLPTTSNLALSSEPGDDRFPPKDRQITSISL